LFKKYLTALSFLTNQYVKLTAVLIMPILVNIVLLDLFVEPVGLVIGGPLFLLTLYVMLYNIESYRPILKRT